MPQERFILITGGARSGKSTFAEKLAAASAKKVIYLATATIEDEEMAQRVRCHRQRRPSDWKTVEEPFEVARAVGRYNSPDILILIDCLALLISNLLLKRNLLEEGILREVENLVKTIKELFSTVIVVTNEVGWGVVPPYPVGRFYRDILGLANQRLASVADQVYLVISGIPVKIK